MAQTARRQIKWFSLVRILGLVLVLTYHFNGHLLPGGFVGVDVFFTFSGFLITSLMIDEFDRSGDFGLLAFYKRRFYRIVPPLVLSVLIVLPLTYLISPDYIAGLGRQVAAAFGFVTNYFEILSGGSYETKFIPHLFVHTWSLAVEMHFYLLWGLLSWGLSRVARSRQNVGQLKVYRGLLFAASLLFAVASLSAMILGSQGLKDFSPVYFSSLTHSFPFFIGAFVGTLSGVTALRQQFAALISKLPAWLSALLIAVSAAGLVALGVTLRFDDHATYEWGMLLAVGLSALMIVSARALDEATLSVREPRILTYLADTSYSMYLYHWPLFVIFGQLMPLWQAVGATIALGLLFSTLSYYVIEPIVAGKKGHIFAWRVGGYAAGVPLTLAVLVLAFFGGQRMMQAPGQTALEQNLWTENLYQKRDDLVANAKQLSPAARIPENAKPVGEDDYTRHNKGSKAQEYGIPAGASIVGDSVTLGIRRSLVENVNRSDVDAAGDRLLSTGIDLILKKQKQGTLREFVVVNLGTNALDDYEKQLKRLIDGIEPGYKLILTTPYNQKAKPNWNSTQIAVIERKLANEHEWITVADWEAIASEHPELFKGTDGVHFPGRKEGEQLYSAMLNEALRTAAEKKPKPETEN